MDNSKVDEHTFAGYYGDLGKDHAVLGLVINKHVRGYIHDDSAYNMDKVEIRKTFWLNENQYESVMFFVTLLEKNPGQYGLYSMNCTLFAYMALHFSGHNLNSGTCPTPYGLGKQLMATRSKTCVDQSTKMMQRGQLHE